MQFLLWIVVGLSMQSIAFAQPLNIIELDKIKHAPTIPNNGILTNETVVDIVRSFIKMGLIDLPLFLTDGLNNQQCFNAKALGESAKGVHSGQLFAISYNEACREVDRSSWRPLYILKETKKGLSEIENLHRVHESILNNEKIPTKILVERDGENYFYPQARVTFEDIHFRIMTHGRNRYFSLLQTAHGRSLHAILHDFGQQLSTISFKEVYQTETYAALERMFYRIGFASSKLHQRYAQHSNKEGMMGRTIIHGDFHAQNIFYDERTEEVTLIDNETFAMSLDNRISGINDIVDLYLLHTVGTIAHHFAKQLYTNEKLGIDDRIWHRLWRKLFLGYILAYEEFSEDGRYELLEEFSEQFKEGLSNKWLLHVPNLTDQRKLKRLGPSLRRVQLRQTLDRVFDDLLIDLLESQKDIFN